MVHIQYTFYYFSANKKYPLFSILPPNRVKCLGLIDIQILTCLCSIGPAAGALVGPAAGAWEGRLQEKRRPWPWIGLGWASFTPPSPAAHTVVAKPLPNAWNLGPSRCAKSISK